MARHPLNAKVTRNRHENVRERRDKPPLPAALVYFQVTDASLRQAASLSSLRQCGHRKTRISVSTLADTIAIRFISAVQRQSGSSVEPATSRRSNFDMRPPSRPEVYVYRHLSPSEFKLVFTVALSASRRLRLSRRRPYPSAYPFDARRIAANIAKLPGASAQR